MAPEVTFYTRPQCPLCEKAKIVLEELQEEFLFEFNEVDINSSDELTEKYGIMIPVVLIDGEEAGYGQIVKPLIRKRLQTK